MSGNKRKILDSLLKHFELSGKKVFLDLFAGTLTVSLAVKKEYTSISCFANDNSKLIYNFFMAVKNKPAELRHDIRFLPYCQDIFYYYKDYIKLPLFDDIDGNNCSVNHAIGFLYCLYSSLYSSGSSFSMKSQNNAIKILKTDLYEAMKNIDDVFQNITITNLDYKDVFKNLSINGGNDVEKIFIYCDPPYIKTRQIFTSGKKWNEKNLDELIEYCISTKCNFAISEFSNDIVLNLAKKYNLNVSNIINRISVKSRETEILLKNY